MVDYNKYTNYTENTQFTSVVFGSNAPILEVELNEVQEIIKSRDKAILALLGKGVLVPSNGTINVNTTDKTIEITDSYFFTQSHAFKLSGITKGLTMTADTYLYLKIEEEEVSYDDTLTDYGVTDYTVISNPIKDSRLGVETSKRKVLNITFAEGSSVPSDSETAEYVEILHFTSATTYDTNYFMDLMTFQKQILSSL